jgi:glycosyltransferase involved in cell wall biosynthesis
MRILITNAALTLRGGTEAYARDLAVALQTAGHDVALYSPILGEAAQELRQSGLPVTDDVAAAPWTPDVLHCHHNMETMTVLLQWPGVPAVFVSHGWVGWPDAPLRHPRVMRYVAVDEPTRDALVRTHAIPEARVLVLPNFVDLARFRPRPPLPPTPRRALVLSHYAREDTHLPAVREACARRGLALDVRGHGAGRPLRDPERILGEYDIVFAKGRAALEAVVVGSAVVVCDAFGVGPMITTRNAEALRTLQGDFMRWHSPLGVPTLLREIDRYDPADVAVLTAWARSVAGADRAVPALVALYEEARAELAGQAPDPLSEARAAARYLAWVSRIVKERLVERDPLAGLAVCLRNRLARIPLLAPALARLSAKIQRYGLRG